MRAPFQAFAPRPYGKKVDSTFSLPMYVRPYPCCTLPTLNLVCKAGVASKQALADTSSENFMNSMRINALSYVKEPRCHPLIEHLASRCFLAVKFASAAMQKTNPSRGKDYTGGSIIMTASGTYPSRILLTNIHIHIPIPPSRRHSLWCRNSGL